MCSLTTPLYVKEGVVSEGMFYAENGVMFGLLALSFAALRFGFVADVTLPGMPVAVIWLLLNAAFVVFDLGLSKLIALYLQRIHKNIK